MRGTIPPARSGRTRRSKMHRARRQGGRDWGTTIGFNPGPNEPFLYPQPKQEAK